MISKLHMGVLVAVLSVLINAGCNNQINDNNQMDHDSKEMDHANMNHEDMDMSSNDKAKDSKTNEMGFAKPPSLQPFCEPKHYDNSDEKRYPHKHR